MGNLLASRLALLLVMTLAIGGRFLVEQPLQSAAPLHPRLAWVFETFEAG